MSVSTSFATFTATTLGKLVIGVVIVLVIATTIGIVLARTTRSEAGKKTVANLNARIRAWWIMVAVFAIAIGTGGIGSIVLFGLMSFFALREFITLTPTALPQLPATMRLEGLSDGPAISTGPSFPPTAALVLPNDRNGWAEVAVNGTKVGVIGPLTVGAIHNVRSGTYSVTMTYSDGFTDALSLSTSHLEGPLVPGGPGARVALGETVDPQVGPPPPATPTMRRVEAVETSPEPKVLTPAPAPAPDAAETKPPTPPTPDTKGAPTPPVPPVVK